jgi:hypothetical protein
LEITNTGSMTVTRDLRLARAGTTTGQGILTVNGGSLTVGREIFVGQSDNPGNPTTFTLNSGTVTNTGTGAVLNVAHQSGNRGNLVINGGTFTTLSALMADGGTGISIASLTVTGGSLVTTVGGYSFAGGNNANPASPTNGAKALVSLSGTGTITSATSMSFGFGTNSEASLNISSGTLNALNSFITFGQGANSSTTVTMSGGTINTDRLNFGNNATAAASLNMSGGTINVTATSAAASRGALGLGSTTPDLDLSGSALISAERLNNNSGGSIDLGGAGILRLKGSTVEASPGVKANTAPTFSMTSAHVGASTWASILGTINLSSFNSRLEAIGTGEVVDGALVTDPDFNINFVSLFNDAIANSKITHNVAGGMFDVGFDGTYSYVRVVPVPEPSSLAMVGLLSVIVGSRRFRRR